MSQCRAHPYPLPAPGSIESQWQSHFTSYPSPGTHQASPGPFLGLSATIVAYSKTWGIIDYVLQQCWPIIDYFLSKLLQKYQLQSQQLLGLFQTALTAIAVFIQLKQPGPLEPRQDLWDTLEDDAAKLAFLEESRTVLEEWALAEAPCATLPGVFCTWPATTPAASPGMGIQRPGQQRKSGPAGSKLNPLHGTLSRACLMTELHKKWDGCTKTTTTANCLYAAAALKNVEKSLTHRELLSVATMKERWDTGFGITLLQKCVHNEVKLASRVTEFLLEKSKSLAHKCSFRLGFRTGAFISMLPRKFKGFDEWVSKVYANDNSAPNDKPAAGGSQDLVYEVAVEFADIENPKDASTIPMLTVFSPAWPLARMRPAWRLYVTKVWYFQTGRMSGGPPWSKLANNTDGIVTLAEGVSVNWTDPSRMPQEEMVKLWKSVVSYQNKSAGQEGGCEFPFTFFKHTVNHSLKKKATAEKCKRAAKAAVAAMGSGSDDDDGGEGDNKEEEKEDDAEALPAKCKIGLAKTSRGPRVKSKEMVESSTESSGDEPPAKK
ncbi:hypothetical protein FIBSPDRAFT_894020 [Athelia psychrophila]|uniref:Uncharacterized protein n=1 Tax=Athelia psychrophila TaxID=1759441 RepID=A0A166GFH1_9AGAM|nr:hypothetical protein FIBSPDRAFT_894020 [Fibularhizoctonia sp. CBS 109695]